MGINNQVEPELKLSAVKEYLGGNGSLNKIAKKYNVCRSTLQKWLLNYELFGEAGLQHRIQNQHYPEALKRQAAEAYLSGQLSIGAVCKNISCNPDRSWRVGSCCIMVRKDFARPERVRKETR